MHLVVIDMKTDIFAIKKEFANPVELVSEDTEILRIRHKGYEEDIDKKDTKAIHHIYIKK